MSVSIPNPPPFVGFIRFMIRITRDSLKATSALDMDDYAMSERIFSGSEFPEPFSCLEYVQKNVTFGKDNRPIMGGDLLLLNPTGDSRIHYEDACFILLDVRYQSGLISHKERVRGYSQENPLVLYQMEYPLNAG